MSSAFDYRAPAELFPAAAARPTARWRTAASRPPRKRSALPIEELPDSALLGAYIQVEDARFDSAAIRRLYGSEQFPLKRKAAA